MFSPMDVVLALQIGHTTSNLLKMFVLLLLMIINMMRILMMVIWLRIMMVT